MSARMCSILLQAVTAIPVTITARRFQRKKARLDRVSEDALARDIEKIGVSLSILLATVIASWAQSGGASLRGWVAFENVAYVDKQPTAKVVLRHDPPESPIVHLIWLHFAQDDSEEKRDTRSDLVGAVAGSDGLIGIRLSSSRARFNPRNICLRGTDSIFFGLAGFI